MWPFRRRTDGDFHLEIEAHVAIEADRLIAQGVSPEDARHRAARAFGNVTKAQERFYESRRILWLDELRQDVRYAWRGLRRSPGFAAVAILTLVLGIGANTAIFSVVNAVILRPLPYRDPGSLVLIETAPLAPAPPWATSAWRTDARTLGDFAGFNGPRAATLIAGGESVQVQSALVTWNFLRFLGAAPAVGRDFAEADAEPSATHVALMSHELWTARFGSESRVIGRTVRLSGDPVTVIGVAPKGFRFPTAGTLPATALPVDTQPEIFLVARPDTGLNVIGRLAAGVTTAAAADELLALFKTGAPAAGFRESLIDRLELRVGHLQDRLAGNVRDRIWLAMGAVGFVLLVACANVANLLLARASTRQHELAVRTALGARKGRLLRLLLTESLLLALAGSTGGLLLAFSLGGVARALLASRVPHVDAIGIDLWVLAFNMGVAVITGVLCGLASIPGAARISLSRIFAGNASSTVTSSSVGRRTLVAVEVAVTFVLVVGAALLSQTYWNLNTQERGFDADQVVTMRVSPGLPPAVGQDFRAGQRFFAAFFTDLTRQLATLPDVTSAAAVSSAPFADPGMGMGRVTVEGQPAPSGNDALALVAAVSPGYFRTLRIDLLAGRDFEDRDRVGSEKVAIVNGAFRRRYAPSGDVVGSHIRSGKNEMTIIGVVDDVPDRTLREPAQPLVFFALSQMPMHNFGWGGFTLVLRSEVVDPLTLLPTVQRGIWAIDPNIVVDEIATMDQRVAATMRSERDSAVLFGLFAVAAVMMAAIGVYGVAAYSIAQRMREIGLRVALGATSRDVSRLVVSQTLWPTAIGVTVGIAGAAMATRFVATMVYGVTPLDARTFAGGVAVLLGVALAATWRPLHRAWRVDPLLALRYE